MTDGITELTAEQVVDAALPLGPAISPDGRLVAYTVKTPREGEPPLCSFMVVAADGGSPAVQLTAVPAPINLLRWAPDSASITYRLKGQLHRIGLDGGPDGGESTAAGEPLTAWQGAISDHWPLADGRSIAVAAEDEPTEEDERREAEGDDARVWGEREPLSRLRLLDLDTGELRLVEALAHRHVVAVVQRPDGGPLAVITWGSPDEDPGQYTAELHLVDPVTRAVDDLGSVGVEACSPAWWSADGDWHVAYLAITPPALVGGHAVLDVTVPGADAAPGPHKSLTSGMGICPTVLVQVADGPPLALFADGFDTALYRLDPAELRFRQLSSTRGRVDSLTASRSGAMVAAMASTAYAPRDVHAGPPGGRLLRLSDTGPELRRITWGTQERLSYKAADGLELDGLLLLPAGRSREDGPFPLVTLVHGGPYDRFADEFLLNPVLSGQWLATGGYAVFMPNPRGSEGRGQDFAATVVGAVGTDEWADIVTGIDLLVAKGVADPDRLGIAGWSHGGFMAAWAVGQTDRFKAALMGAGISDWGMQAAVSDVGFQDTALGGSIGWEGSGPHRHDQLSPVSFASRIRTPVLIVHGEEDTNVPFGQALYFHRALRHYGVDHEFVSYPREGHLIRERNHQLDLLRRSRDWFDRKLGAEPS
ncbi:prolyl oligopeptidase family serine peptidase [Streptacidiphilus sp. EB103A]|uniref:prolyl oligopeptidase family serine peptidase n=1 Tax=Streptacidiphilus sp. EB103A TaxID=3156275 RepID=UPI0035155FCF